MGCSYSGCTHSHRAFVGLGSNLDDPERQIETAIAGLEALPSTRVVRRSRRYRTEPVGYADQPDFVNAVAELETALEPQPLMRELFALEQAHRRVRGRRNGPRTLDLDLLLYDERELDEPGLILPHPRMHERAFVLVPLHEIAPQANVPGRGRVSALLGQVDARGVARCEGR
ncbi:MAG: 2-amino-4-hydroxy-6-hydroxymethyldihydropteridine diphosphokinase [Burkholderiales bacterium]